MNSPRRESANAVTEALNVRCGRHWQFEARQSVVRRSHTSGGTVILRAINARDKNAGASQGSSYKHTCEKL